MGLAGENSWHFEGKQFFKPVVSRLTKRQAIGGFVRFVMKNQRYFYETAKTTHESAS
jgi:hypothetical protein